MLFVDNLNHSDPARNLALEEYLIRSVAPDEELLLFYINKPSIIIGRNQNTIEEINVDYVHAHGIHVVRRLSGGGAVYHDFGNLNFSFIAPYTQGNFQNFRKFTAPVISVLQNMGVPAELSGRNDILADGRKISGNAQYVAGQRMVSHGTLLYQSDLDMVGHALRVKPSKIESKGIKSVRSRVTNIAEFLTNPPDIMLLRQAILEQTFEGCAEIPQYHLSEADWKAVEQLKNERYDTWEWNYGRSPAFNLRRETRYPGGSIEALLDVHKGVITHIRFFGDFFGQRDVAELEAALAGCAYAGPALKERLESLQIGDYFAGFTAAELFTLLY